MPNQNADAWERLVNDKEFVFDAKYWKSRKRFYLQCSAALLIPIFISIIYLKFQDPFNFEWIQAAMLVFIAVGILVMSLIMYWSSHQNYQKELAN